ncbi:ATP-binding cassette domain-containing protein [Cohnella ginsengisoli]|uniref:ATP-binding cassette domain-containing protein n=1 Tax=Cohnella ginsengisoli TaxID=425004 RepID=UPI003B8A5C69
MSVRREDPVDDAAVNASAILDRVDLTLSPGEWLYVVGTNGSGKSTLGKIVAGLGFPGELRAERWERGFAGDDPAPYVMQHPDAQLFGTTPREEIVFALEWLGVQGSRIMRLAEEVLDEVGLAGAADQPWSALSGGTAPACGRRRRDGRPCAFARPGRSDLDARRRFAIVSAGACAEETARRRGDRLDHAANRRARAGARSPRRRACGREARIRRQGERIFVRRCSRECLRFRAALSSGRPAPSVSRRTGAGNRASAPYGRLRPERRAAFSLQKGERIKGR